MIHKTTDSIKNSNKITHCFAPIAFLIPIILVRSFTETNIIFATLNIPTKSAKPPIIQPTMFKAENNLAKPSAKTVLELSEKLSFSCGFK